jgi:hypothetical protein
MWRNLGHLAAWTIAWVASLALASFGPGRLWPEHPAGTLALIALNLLIGLGMLLANKRHLWELDELHRAVQLHAMAWALGAGLVVGMAWTLVESHDLLGFEARIPHLLMFLSVVYFAAVVIGMRRYR